MTERKPSKTASGAAALRAAHQLIDGDPKILDDPVVMHLLDESILNEIQEHPERLHAPRVQALRTHILVRSRFAEDQLAEAAGRNISQYVILGAGLDTFAYRQPAWAGMLRIFEVDQPASQMEKRERLESAAIPIPANLTYVVVDFETDSLLSALQRAGFDPLQPVFLSWLGVMAYLRRDTIETIFRSVASLPKSSEIVFTFASESPERKANASSSATETRAESLGEPWLSRFEPVDIDRMLRGMGFSDVSFLTPDEIDQRYIRGRQDGLFVMRRINIASARV